MTHFVVSADLFDRLRGHRGYEAMVLSSHRFGKSTQHTDHILCVLQQLSVIVSSGDISTGLVVFL